MLTYKIEASVVPPGEGTAKAKELEIKFDGSNDDIFNLPNPAELLLTSFAACVLKNIQRYSEKLKIDYKKASIIVNGERNDNPPYMKKIDYTVYIDTDANDHRLHNLQRNVIRFGTITNTLLKAAEINGEFIKSNIE